MTIHNDKRPLKINRALLSVSDKRGLVDFARGLRQFDIEIISTGGTAKTLREGGIAVRDVSEITGFPEMLGGRVKTLHPRIHGALLALRDNAEHMDAVVEHGIHPIDLLVVNLYPFEETIAHNGVNMDEAIEQIDIGGPAMIRSAAKNWSNVAVIVSPNLYGAVLKEIAENGGALTIQTKAALAQEAFKRTSAYDSAISSFLETSLAKGPECSAEGPDYSAEVQGHRPRPEAFGKESLGETLEIHLRKLSDLRYGENPHQSAAVYQSDEKNGVAFAELLSGKQMSFNNYVDADAAWDLVTEFDESACAIVKHTNPSGVAVGNSAEEAYMRALETDPVSAFGGIVAFNGPVDDAAARAVTRVFTEVVLAPHFETSAIEILSSKKNLRVLRVKPRSYSKGLEYRKISGGMLVQSRDVHRITLSDLRVVTQRQPSDEEIRALLFAWKVCKHTKSNAIVYARNGQTVGVGAGQMSRIDSVKLGATRARLTVRGSVLASDAFFPFRDGIDEAAKQGVSAIIQPGGSVRDDEVIAAANGHGLGMVFTGVRHFKH